MAKNLLKLALLTSVIILTHQLLQFKDGHQLTLGQIQRDPFIEVVQTSSEEIDGLKKQFLMVRVIQIKQQFARSKMVRIQEKVKKMLWKYRLINNEDQFVMSNIQPVFLINSRKWSYSMIFAVAGEGSLVQGCYKQLTAIGIMRVKSISTINFLNQKILSIDAFNKAKAVLAKIIQKFSKMEMKSIQKLDIFGDTIKNEEIIEYQVKNEGMGTDLSLVQTEFAKLEHQQFSLIRRKNFGISVIFRVGNPFIQPEEDSDEYESDYSTEDYSEDSYY